MSILQKTIDHLLASQTDYLQSLIIEDLVIGVFKTVVKLSDQTYGLSSTAIDNYEIHCKKEDRDFGDFTAGKIKGIKVLDLLQTNKKSSLLTTLKVAVVNAVSSRLLSSPQYKILNNTDPIDLLELHEGVKITLVGAFHSYIKKAKEKNCRLRVLELEEQALEPIDRQYFVPANTYSEIIPDSDILIITGLTIVNETIDDLLKCVQPNTKVIITGPSSSFIPDIFFEEKVDMIGSIGIKNPELLWQIVSEGGAGYHTLRTSCEKVCVLKTT